MNIIVGNKATGWQAGMMLEQAEGETGPGIDVWKVKAHLPVTYLLQQEHTSYSFLNNPSRN